MCIIIDGKRWIYPAGTLYNREKERTTRRWGGMKKLHAKLTHTYVNVHVRKQTHTYTHTHTHSTQHTAHIRAYPYYTYIYIFCLFLFRSWVYLREEKIYARYFITTYVLYPSMYSTFLWVIVILYVLNKFGTIRKTREKESERTVTLLITRLLSR